MANSKPNPGAPGDNSTKTVLVTGGAGFIGSHLCDALHAAGHAVVCVDDLSQGRLDFIEQLRDKPGFAFHQCDLLDAGAFTAVLDEAGPIDAVFHLAANSDIRLGIEDHRVDLEKTFMTTFAVLSEMRARDIPQLVFASTSAVYGERETALDEDSGPLLPISPYGAAKLSAEAFISAFSACYGIQSWIVRFPNVVGPRSTHGVVHDFVNKLTATPHELQVLGDGRQAKPYLYVADLVAGICFVWSSARERLNVYNVGVDSTTTVARIAEMVRQEMGLAGAEIVYTGGDRGWVGDVPRFRYDLSRIHALGWRAGRSSDEAVHLAVRAELESRACQIQS